MNAENAHKTDSAVGWLRASVPSRAQPFICGSTVSILAVSVQQRCILRCSRLPSCSRHLCTALDLSTVTPARELLTTSLPMMRYVWRGRSLGQRHRKSATGTQTTSSPRRSFSLPFLKISMTWTPSFIQSPTWSLESTRACIAARTIASEIHDTNCKRLR